MNYFQQSEADIARQTLIELESDVIAPLKLLEFSLHKSLKKRLLLMTTTEAKPLCLGLRVEGLDLRQDPSIAEDLDEVTHINDFLPADSVPQSASPQRDCAPHPSSPRTMGDIFRPIQELPRSTPSLDPLRPRSPDLPDNLILQFFPDDRFDPDHLRPRSPFVPSLPRSPLFLLDDYFPHEALPAQSPPLATSLYEQIPASSTFHPAYRSALSITP
jgi:hypothetical protein